MAKTRGKNLTPTQIMAKHIDKEKLIKSVNNLNYRDYVELALRLESK